MFSNLFSRATSLIIAVITLATHQTLADQGTVYYDTTTNQYSFVSGVLDESGAAFGTFENTLNSTGWGVLRISSNSVFADEIQMFAGGYLEGALTWSRISEMSLSMNEYFFKSTNGTAPSIIVNFFNDQQNWLDEKLQSSTFINEDDQRILTAAKFIDAQFKGLVAGYQAIQVNAPLNTIDFQVLNGVGDLLDLISALQSKDNTYSDSKLEFNNNKLWPIDWFKLSHDEFFDAVFARSMCSALVKLTADYSELYAGHSSWFTYSAMNRIYKYYTFPLKSQYLKSKTVSFSSYPGFLESLDDFYIMSNGLTMIQTTNSIFNQTLYSSVKPQSLFAWQRVRAANAFAADGQDWYKLVSLYNSGTYNNQYMVIDYNKFIPNTPLQKNTLWVVEQIPGLVVGDDITHELERGYFPSFNIPYFEQIYNLSGYPDAVSKYGYSMSYELAPRAKIFRRDQGHVVDLDSFKSIMRYNNYQTDPFSNAEATDSICARGDLSKRPRASGCYDTKVTSSKLAASLESFALNGPTVAGGDSGALLNPFSWDSSFSNQAHYGQPVDFHFDFVNMKP